MTPYRAIKAIFVESGTYQTPALRTYETQYNDAIVSDYLEQTHGGTHIVPNAFANISSQILHPSAAPTGVVGIENGWSTRRMTFLIEIEVGASFIGAGGQSVVLTGYTDFAEVSPFTQSFDPNMKLYFNASSVINTVTQRNGDATRQVKAIVDSSHLLSRNNLNNIQPLSHDVYNGNALFYATPRNVIYEMNNINNTIGGSSSVTDTRIRGNEMAVNRSRLENALPTSYLSKILRGVTDGMSTMSMGIAVDENDALINAAAAVSEDNRHVDRVMMDITMYDSGFYLHNGYITFGQLNAIVPNLDAVLRFTNRKSKVVTDMRPEAEASSFNHWSGVNPETIIANNIAQLVPAIMTGCMIGNISFAFTNDNITMTPTLVITNGQALIDGVYFKQLQSKFETRFLSEVAPGITDQGRTMVVMVVHCSLGTETFITVSRNGEPEIPYCAPTFCDSLYTPIIAPNQQMLTDIASDLQNIANSVNNSYFTGHDRPLF